MRDLVDQRIDEIEACEILEMLAHFVENAPQDPTRAQLRIMVGLLHGGISGAIEKLRDPDIDVDNDEGLPVENYD